MTSMRHAYANATIRTAAGESVENGTLLIEDGKFLFPGVVDPHSHTGVWGGGAVALLLRGGSS